jgi:glucokinase
MSAKIGLCDGGVILRETRIATGENTDFAILVQKLAETISSLAESEEYDFVGISSCGLIDSARGTVVYSNNIRWENKPFADELSRLTGKKTAIANDAKCAALAEAVYGAGKGKERVCLLTLGTGVGGGFVVNGRLSSGNRYADADMILGHIAVEKDGRVCTCGRRGCLEAYASATAVMRSYREKTGISCTAKEIFDEARKGGTPERETVEEFIDYLSEGIADIVNILRPEIVAIGGGLSGASDLFIEKVSALVNEKIFGGKFLPVEVVAAKLQNDAGIIGATLLDK